MKLNLQNKLLLPSLSTLIVLMLGASFLLGKQIENQLEEDTIELLRAGNNILIKNVTNIADAYSDQIRAISALTRLTPLAEYLSGGSILEESQEAALAKAQKTLEGLTSTYDIFDFISMAGPDGTVVASSNKSDIGNNIGNENCFKSAMNQNIAISDPIMARQINDKAILIAAPVKNKQGKISAVVYAAISGKKLAEATIERAKMGDAGYSYLVSDNGIMAAHHDYSKVQTMNMFDSQPWMKNVSKGESGLKTDYQSSSGVNYLAAYSKDPISGWLAVTVYSKDELSAQIGHIRNITILVLMLTAAIVAVVLVLAIRKMTRDVQTTNNFAQAIAAGNLDKTLDVYRNDELGSLGDALRKMVESLKNMIVKGEEEAAKAQEEAQKAQKAMEEANKFAQHAEEAQANILSVAERLEHMGSAISSATTQLAAQIEQSNIGAEESASRLAEAASAMNEMNSTVQEVTSNAAAAASASADTREKAIAGEQVVHKAVDSIEEMRKVALELKDDMTELNEHAQSISKIMGVVSDIADQTNLLALNAAIEAARAGEAGRGFAVVADEVRKLAGKTMVSTADVGNATTAIQNSTAKSMEGMTIAVERLEEATQFARESGAALREIVDNVEATTDQVTAIATASEEQSAASEEINRSITEVNNLSSQTAQAMNEAAQAISDLSHQTHQLHELMQEMQQKKD